MEYPENKKIKILQVAPWTVHGPGVGGMASVVQDLTANLRLRGHCVEILAGAWDAVGVVRDGPEWKLRLPGTTPQRKPVSIIKSRIQIERSAWRLAAWCKKRHIEVIHAHFAGTYLQVLARARALGGPPYLVTCHRGDVLAAAEMSPHEKHVLETGLASASRCVAVSKWLARTAESVFSKNNIDTVPNGFEPDPLDISHPVDVQCDRGRPVPESYAIMVANMRYYKGHDIALAAWRELKQYSNLPLVMVGSGQQGKALKRIVEQYEIEDYIFFMGHLDRKTTIRLISGAAMLVAPSRNEGQGLIILEAASQKCPVICSDIAPFREMVDPGISGFMFPNEDAGDLVEAVRQLENDYDLCRRLSSNLYSTLQSRYSVKIMIDRYEQIYKKIRSQ